MQEQDEAGGWMTTQRSLFERLESIIKQATTQEPALVSSPFLRRSSEALSNLALECLELQKEVAKPGVSETDLLNIKGRVIVFEATANRLAARHRFWRALLWFTGIYFGLAILFALFIGVDVPAWVTKILGVQAPEKLVTLGVAGAFLYLATSSLVRLESQTEAGGLTRGLLAATIRLALAVVVPVILVSLFFDEKGKFRQFSVTPELLSFVSGYSAKLVIDILSKLVEKISQMISAA